MKKIISIFLVLCMMATLMPTVAFATGGDTENVAPIVSDFTIIKKQASISVSAVEAYGFDIVEDKSNTTMHSQNDGKGLQVQGYYNAVWPTSANPKQQMFTINIKAEKAGYYNPEFIYEACIKGGDFAVYINGQYAGIANAYDANYAGGGVTTTHEKKLNTVYLNENTNEVSFRCVKHYRSRENSWLILDKLTFTYCGDDFSPVDFSGNIPSKINAGEPVDFAVSANINENLTKFYATYNEEGTAITNPEGIVTVTSNDGTVETANQTATGATGTFTANAAGKATLTVSTTINGRTYTEDFEIDVIGPIVTDFTKLYTAKATNISVDTLISKGLDVVKGKSTTAVSHFMVDGTSLQIQSSFRYKWPASTDSSIMFTINISADTAGYYSPEFIYEACGKSGTFAIYINGQYAGSVNAHDATLTAAELRTANLNTIYLIAGKNEVSFKCTAHGRTGNNNSWLILNKLTLTPCDEDFEVGIQDTITMSVTGTAGKVTVDGTVQNSDTQTYSAKVGETVTVVAKDIEGKVFRGWLRGGENGDPVCPENTYTFTAATNVALYAKYTDAPSADEIEYYDWNGEFLGNTDVSSTLSKYGFTFKEWKSAVVNGITRYVADYVTKNTYAITKPSNVNADKDLDSVSHDTPITLKSETPVSWYVNEKLVACGDTYTFLATQAARVLTDSLVTVGPIVNLTNPEGDTYILEYNANGKNVIEKGIIFGGNGSSVTSCSYKVISQRNDACGKLMAENDKGCTVVRGYIIYNDNDTYRVVYADIAE